MQSKTIDQYKAILLDLDGTLLDLDVGRFIPAYIELLAEKFSNRIEKELFAGHLFRSTGKMLEDDNPSKKNAAVFYEDFIARIGMTLEEIRPIIDDFYKNDFPALNSYGRKHPHSKAVLNAAHRRGLTLVLATNPIFPKAAIEERMKWGELSAGCFDLVTSMDNMHFCKPNPDYYLEISHLIGIKPEKCLMAGNDTLEDLNASAAGMDTFLVDDFILEREGIEPACNYRGSLKDLADFLKV